jgi:nucleoside 2-deoxyribosyltransferase
MAADLKPIETVYRGYRFRSRLEARWAVFFDTLAIPWEYERQGFDLGNDGWYLPDFFLPTLDWNDWTYYDSNHGVWVEVKREGVTETEMSKTRAFGARADHPVYITDGDPMASLLKGSGSPFSEYPQWDIPIQCAMRVARQVRFEHRAEIPKIYPPHVFVGSVYLAGKVSGWNDTWRNEIRAVYGEIEWDEAGPEIFKRRGHCQDEEYIVETFQACWRKANSVFAWIDSGDAHGTLFEIGLARGERKPVFIAFEDEAIRNTHWFIAEQVPHVIAPTVNDGWQLFLGHRLHVRTGGTW